MSQPPTKSLLRPFAESMTTYIDMHYNAISVIYSKQSSYRFRAWTLSQNAKRRSAVRTQLDLAATALTSFSLVRISGTGPNGVIANGLICEWLLV